MKLSNLNLKNVIAEENNVVMARLKGMKAPTLVTFVKDGDNVNNLDCFHDGQNDERFPLFCPVVRASRNFRLKVNAQ